MERAAWTDQRLDDLAEEMRSGFGRIDEDMRGLRSEMGGLRSEMHSGDQGLRAEIGELRIEMRDEFRSVRAEFASIRSALLGVGGGIIVSLIGVIGAILARGA